MPSPRRRAAITIALSLLAVPATATAVPTVTFKSPSVQGDGNVLLSATVTASPGDCGGQNALGCQAQLALGTPSGGVAQGSSLLFWDDDDPTYALSTTVPIKGMAAGTYNAFAALVNGGGTTRTYQGPSFQFPTSSLRVSRVALRREAGALTVAYRVRDGGTLSGADQQARARTVLTMQRTGGSRSSAAKRFRATLRSQPGANRAVLPFRITRKVRRGERYRVTVEVRDRLKRRHRASARARL